MKREPGYKKLIVWQNAQKLRRLIYETTKQFPKSEMRRIGQMNDSSRSVKQNIQEGYMKTLPGYINHLNISQGSLLELRGDIEDCFDDGLIDKNTFLKIDELTGKTEYLFKRLIQSLVRKRDGKKGF
ncbi:MAG: four helix bundle protein [Candidatus Omnitrophota bacterium]